MDVSMLTDDSGDVGFVKLKVRLDNDSDESHCIISSSSVEKRHAVLHCSVCSLGVAVATTFSVLDRNKKQENTSNLYDTK